MLSIVVPAYNEGEHIYDNLMTIDKALKAFTSDYEIIAVNDGSKDNTGAEVARAAHDNPNIKDFGYEVNRGKGGAVSWGAVNSKGDIVGFIDADLDLSPDFIKMYFEEMNASGADIVIGSKMHKDSKLEYPFARKVFSICYYIMLKVLFGLKCHDTQTGLKLYRGSIIREIAPLRKIDGYAFDIELLALASKKKAKLIEMPVELNYTRGESFGRIRMGDPKIFSMEELPEFCKTHGVTMAVVAVPDYACQEVCDAAVAAGISKILNFSSAKPEVPSGILVEHLNIALSLAALKHTEG